MIFFNSIKKQILKLYLIYWIRIELNAFNWKLDLKLKMVIILNLEN